MDQSILFKGQERYRKIRNFRLGKIRSSILGLSEDECGLVVL
jgi:hypothetical protein